MMLRTTAPFLILASMLSVTSAIEVSWKRSAPLAQIPDDILPPSKDPWYTAPKGYEHAAPGAVLRVRDAPGLAAVIVNCSAAYNILYRTTDSNYKPAWAVTALYVPRKSSESTSERAPPSLVAPPFCPTKTLVNDSANVDSSSSYTFYTVPPDPMIPAHLGQGWFVNIPNYEGPLASFTIGASSGHATIDSISAVLNHRFGLSSKIKYALFGYSGGSLASVWAAELQAQYAPEMHFAGIVIGGIVPNVTSVLKVVNETPFAELVPQGILGLTGQDPAARKYILSQLKTSGPHNKTGFLAALTQNTTVSAAQYSGQDMFEYFTDGARILQAPVLQRLISRDSMQGYHGVPQMPVFAYKAMKDELAPVADTDKLVARWCQIGVDVLYQRNSNGGHLTEAINGANAAFAFLTAVLEKNGEGYLYQGCRVQDITEGSDNPQ